MEFLIVVHWWIVPLVIFVVGTFYALFIYDDGGGMLSGLGNILLMIPVLFMTLISIIVMLLLR